MTKGDLFRYKNMIYSFRWAKPHIDQYCFVEVEKGYFTMTLKEIELSRMVKI
jgi:hypothetical protein